jgi:hypothetical protein
MKEELITFETAVLAKSFGFDQNPSYGFYEKTGKLWWSEWQNGKEDYICCTQSFLQRWLRETRGIEVWVTPLFNKEYKVNWFYITLYQHPNFLCSYEEALELGLYNALKTIK